jgi:acetolactate synthase-1/2/3 large subunit
MSQRTTGEAIVDTLIANGVDTVFGLPGAQTYPLFDALYRRRDEIRTVGARHEQALAYMAFGYARSSGRLGVYAPVPGPGVLNTTAAMCTAYGACAPTLCITGEVPSDFKGKGRGHLHELPDQLGILQRLTRHARHIERPEDAPAAINAAIGAALSGRRGPAAVSVCWDTLAESARIPACGAAEVAAAAAPQAAQVSRCVRLIREAHRPMIFIGSGAQHAAGAVQALAQRLQASVVAHRGGRGIVSEDQPLSVDMASAWHLWSEVDLMIGIGTRLEVPFLYWGSMMKAHRALPGRRLIRIDIDPDEMERLDTDGPLVADAEAGVRALLAALDAAGYVAAGNPGRIAAAKERTAVEIRQVQPQMEYLEVIREALPRDGFLVEELSQVGFASHFGWPVYEPRTYVSCGYQGTLGFGFPSALGVKAAHPARAVVSITGDGGFMFALPELATAVQYGIGVVTIVFDNSAFENVRRDQQQRFGGREIGSRLLNPDFHDLARTFGVDAYRVDSPAALRPALQRALASGGPSLIHVQVRPTTEVSPWPFILRTPLMPQVPAAPGADTDPRGPR